MSITRSICREQINIIIGGVLMIIFKKASPEDIEDVVFAIMQMKDTDTNITVAESMDFIDHCYYAYDDVQCVIVAVIAAVREVLNEFSQVEGSVINTHPNRYKIKYMVGDDYSIEEFCAPYTLQSVMVHLVKELVNDMNEWAVWVDTDDIYKTDEYHDQALYRALRSNSFAHSVTEPTVLIRAMAVDFDALH